MEQPSLPTLSRLLAAAISNRGCESPIMTTCWTQRDVADIDVALISRLQQLWRLFVVPHARSAQGGSAAK
jgi:hypothetical protein